MIQVPNIFYFFTLCSVFVTAQFGVWQNFQRDGSPISEVYHFRHQSKSWKIAIIHPLFTVYVYICACMCLFFWWESTSSSFFVLWCSPKTDISRTGNNNNNSINRGCTALKVNFYRLKKKHTHTKTHTIRQTATTRIWKDWYSHGRPHKKGSKFITQNIFHHWNCDCNSFHQSNKSKIEFKLE
jgi:hypothetical protein